MSHTLKILTPFFLILFTAFPSLTLAGSIEPFIGSYAGSADFQEEDVDKHRDMSTIIEKTDDGFTVSWTSVIFKSDGRIKDTSYSIEFVASNRENIYASAMKTNVFGKQIPLDPLLGEPFVWSKIDGDTLTLFSLFINEVGDYEMQQYDRTLAEGGLNLDFRRFRNGQEERRIQTLLKRN